MSKPWEPEHDISIDNATEMIEKQFPQLKPAQVTILGEGFDNSVFLVNNQYVFRFPRRQIAATLMETECRILPLIAPMLPFSIPHPQFLGIPENEYPWPFAGYEMLRGNTPVGLTEEQRAQSAKPLALFLKNLHSFPTRKAKQLSIPYDQLGRLNLVKRKPMLEENIERAMEQGLLDSFIVEKLNSFLATISGPFEDETLALVHGDLHIKNMLVSDKGEISAVIDWGDLHIGHPVIDLSIVYSFLPAAGRNEFFQWYGDVLPEWKKAAKFKAIYTLMMLLLYADAQNDQVLRTECDAALRLALT
ncbi:phosphotransferase [Neobacillus dielmonensis]|uniref:phosphotransferase n=1 Tax=Neobacillus dielmonensis TaxID=1347369 RepID=UPI0005AA9363|nr:phosphotransferase [Neobacillus dielmonensis]